MYNVHPRVTTTADSGPGSLREAIAGARDGDTIQFDTAVQGQFISLTSGELVIDKSITISGFLFNNVTVHTGLGLYRRVFHIMPGCTVTLEGLTIRNGGGFANFAPGGGVLNDNATLILRYCTVKDNFSFGAYGGGIFSFGSSATLTIVNSSVTNNRVSGGPGEGGGIYSSGGMLTITDSTVSGNYAIGRAGGIFSDFSATLTINHSTFSGNSADGSGGGINLGNGTLHLGNTALKAGSSGANLVNNSGAVISYGYNLSSDNGGGFLNATGDRINTDPMLGPLQNNGGPTFTHALLSGSAAINAGNPNFTPPPLSDQRDFNRVENGRIDIGSFEFRP